MELASLLLSSLGIILSIVFGVRAEKTKQDLEEYKKQEKKRDLWQNLNLDREEILQNACDCIKLIESAAPIAFDNAKLNTTLTKLKSELNRCIDRYKELLEENILFPPLINKSNCQKEKLSILVIKVKETNT